MKINIIGPLLGSSGFARHVRELARALHNLGMDVSIESNLYAGWERDIDSLFVDMVRNNYRKEHNIFIDSLNILPIKFSDNCKSLIPYVIFEGDKLPAYWADILNRKEIFKESTKILCSL